MKLIKKINKKENKSYVNFYLQLENGNLIAVEPKEFTTKNGKVSTYKELNALAELVH